MLQDLFQVLMNIAGKTNTVFAGKRKKSYQTSNGNYLRVTGWGPFPMPGEAARLARAQQQANIVYNEVLNERQ